MSKSPGLLPVALLQCLFIIRGLAAEKASVPEFVEESETLDNSTFVRARGQTTHGVTFTIQSEYVMVFMDQPMPVSINYSIDCSAVEDSYGILFDVPEQYVFKIVDKGPIFLHHTASSCKAHGSAHGEVFITLTGILPGRGSLLITVLPGVTSATINSTKSDGSLTYSPATIPSHGNLSSWAVPMNGSEQFPARFTVVCLKKPTQLDTVMQYVMMIYLVLLMLAMGCKTKVEVLKQVWRRPVAPAIGLFCQFVLMPLIAFGLTQVITFPTPGMALGFFACGCCPGGGASNLWTHLLGGDVSLSVALTTVSNLAAIGTFPLWIFTLGRIVLTDQTHLKIPYLNIVVSLLMIAIPLAVGCVINYKRPAFTKKLLKVFIPILVILTIGFISLVLYLNLYMFRLIKPILILAGALLPYIGYACAMALSILFRQSWSYCKTIAIETGIQNAGIAFIMVMFSFPPPDNVIAGTAPMASSSMTPIPLMVVAAIYHIYLRCCAKKSSGADNSKDENFNTDDKENVTCPESKAMLEKVSSL